MAVVFVVAVAIGRPAGPMAFKAWRSPSTTSSTAAVSPRSLRFSLHFLHFGLSFFFSSLFFFFFLVFSHFSSWPTPSTFLLSFYRVFFFVRCFVVRLPPPPSLPAAVYRVLPSFFLPSFVFLPPPPEPSVSTFGTEFHRLAKGFVDLPGLPGFYSFLFVFPILFFLDRCRRRCRGRSQGLATVAHLQQLPNKKKFCTDTQTQKKSD